jgi:hypothetical protein
MSLFLGKLVLVALAAGVPAAAVAQWLEGLGLPTLVMLGCNGLSTTLLFALLAKLLRFTELDAIWQALGRRLRRG